GSAGAGASVTVTSTGGQASPGTAPGITTQGPFQGSVPTGQPTGTVIPITLKETLDPGLKYKRGIIERNQSTRAALAHSLHYLSSLLPTLYGQVQQSVDQVNLQAQGLRLQNIPGIRIPTIIGPFSVQDVRGYLTQSIFNWSNIQNWRSASQSEAASK